MNPAIQAKLDQQQSSMLEKLSSIIDNTTQMSELKKIRITEPHTFKNKRHKQQYKRNKQVKSEVSEAKDAVNSRKQDVCFVILSLDPYRL